MASLCPDRVCILRYEDLHAHPLKSLQPVFRLLGIDADEATIRSCVDGASFQRLSKGRDRGTTDEESFFRKGVIGDWREELDAETEAAVVQPARTVMERFDYVI